MMKQLVKQAMASLGYQIVPLPPPRPAPSPLPPLNVRVDRDDLRYCLGVIEQIVVRDDSSMTLERSHRYLDEQRVGFYYAVLDLLESTGILRPGARVLDVGVYFGYMLRMIHRHHPGVSCHGTETNETRLEVARRLCPDAEIRLGSIDDLNPDQPFDLIILTEVLEHLVVPSAAIQKLATIGKALLFTVPDGRVDRTEAMQFNEKWGSYRGHVNFWSPESWRYMLDHELPGRHVTTGELPTTKMYGLIR